MNRCLTCVFMLTTVGVMAVISSGCDLVSEQDDAPRPRTVIVERTVEATEQSNLPEDTESSTDTEKSCEVGQECDLGESTVVVTSAQESQSINTSLGDTFEGSFVLVEFDYTYGGTEPVDLGEPPFQLQDGSGNRYSLNFDATSSYGIDNNRSLIYETVQPGVQAPGTAIFEVSPGAEDFTLLIEDLVSPQSNVSASVPLTLSEQPVAPSTDDTQQQSAPAATPDAFVSSYYDAVSREDWSATYAMLDSESQAAFTEDDWIQRQIARNSAASPLPLTSAIVNSVSEQGVDQVTNITLNYEDGSQETLDITLRVENGEIKRHLTAEEIAFLQTL